MVPPPTGILDSLLMTTTSLIFFPPILLSSSSVLTLTTRLLLRHHLPIRFYQRIQPHPHPPPPVSPDLGQPNPNSPPDIHEAAILHHLRRHFLVSSSQFEPNSAFSGGGFMSSQASQAYESSSSTAKVLPLVQKFVDYRKLECLSTEMKKEIKDIVVSINKLPKAPWDEGVCKVCGVDKDDDSVLLCDTCDAEYHTYCLNPPLIRIPDGNWYCPSCVIAKRIAQDALESYKLVKRRKGRKYQGELTRASMETTAHLADVMEEKDYWEFSAEERD